MKYAADFRRIARDGLRGRWGIPVIAGVIASMLGGVASGGPELNFELGDNGADIGFEIAGQKIFSTAMGWNTQIFSWLLAAAGLILVAALVMAVLYFILGSVVGVGYQRFQLDLVDRKKELSIGTMFTYFPRWKTMAAARFLQGLYVFLWSLLLIIPGIMAGYSYAMTEYILAEHPEMTADEAITRSKEMMYGNRFRLFCLHFSFIGWDILCALTLGIGYLWLTPYKQAAAAAFYREVSETESYPSSSPEI